MTKAEEKLNELSREMKYYIQYLEYKHKYPYSAFGIYCSKTNRYIYQDEGFILGFQRWVKIVYSDTLEIKQLTNK